MLEEKYLWRTALVVGAGWWLWRRVQGRMAEPQVYTPHVHPSENISHWDSIDEAAWESFPASDAPAWGPAKH